MDAGRDTERLARALAELPDLAGLPDHRAFERLSAMVVCRWLGERTLHDVTLRGGSGAAHQIDVLVGDERQRALIECKYYARGIDMPIVRNFFGAVADLGCDLAAIISTVGFSRNVKMFAAAHGIDLLLLGDSRDADLDGRVRRVQIDIEVFGAHLRRCRVVSLQDGLVEPVERQLRVTLDDETCFLEYTSGRRVPFAERYRELEASFGFDDPDGVYPVADEFQAPTWLVANDVREPITRIEWEWVVSRSSTPSVVVEHEPLVSLVSADGDVLEVVSEEQLRSMQAQRGERQHERDE